MRNAQSIVANLYPPGLNAFGIVSLIEADLSSLEAHIRCRARLEASLPLMPPQQVGVTIYRIFGEGRINIQSHAGSVKNVAVSLTYSEGIFSLQILDDGRGFDLKTVEQKPMSGLANMRLRTEILGGTFEVMSASGQGTKVITRIPIKTDDIEDI